MKHSSLPLLPHKHIIKTIFQALTGEHTTLAGMFSYLPGPLPIRLSVVLGNMRMQRMLDHLVQPGEIVVDVGANIGYNTLYAAKRVGPMGRVYAIEPAQDNLAILYANLFANRLDNVVVLPYAAGTQHEIKQFFIRGEVSAVNSLFQDNFYHPVTEIVEVLAAPLDQLVPVSPHIVKIDVEGGELDVLQGMPRILTSHNLRLIVEWHPTLQQASGHAPDALPRHLLNLGFSLTVVTHTHMTPLRPANIPELTAQLLRKRSPVELLAYR